MKRCLPLLLSSLFAVPALGQTPTALPAGARPSGAPGTPAPTTAPRLALPDAPKGSGRLTGTVLDATTKKPVEFATVALLPATGERPIDGTACDERGRFVLKGLAAGSYRVQVTFVGYGARVEAVTVTDGTVDLGDLTLTATAQKLGEVTVTGEKDVIETKPDRIVYNADRDLTNTGGTAADVLRKVPLVNVDPDGNVELRGSTNVRVLINNKPSGIVAASVADAMKQIPADQIKSVEVITTPSAKYDAEGTGGIINITLKKSNLEGTNGSVGLAAGTRSSNANASLNVRRGKIGINSSLNGWTFYAPNSNNLMRSIRNEQGEYVQTLRQEGDGFTIGGGGFTRLGLDYDPSKNHNLNLSVQGNMFRNQGDYDQFNQPAGIPSFTRATDRAFRTQSYDVSSSYTRTFEEQAKREWTVLGQHTRNRNTQRYDLDQFSDRATEGETTYREGGDNLSRNLETTLQTDYAHPFSETATFETGVKGILRRVSSNYDVQIDPTGQNGLERSDARSNTFDYDQDVLSAYGTYGFSFSKKVSTRIGTRLEHTDITGRFTQGEASRFTQNYTNLLPNVSLSYQPGKPGQTVRLAYSRRIQRPQIFYLNPFINASDSLNISYGNPRINPEFTDSYEFNYTTFIKGSVINGSAYVRRTGNAIETVRFVDENGVQNQTFRNIGRNATYGASLFGSVKPVPLWELSANLNFYYVTLRSPALDLTGAALNNSGLMYNMNINSSYKFAKFDDESAASALRGLAVQFFGGINSPRIQLQGQQAAWTFYSMGLRKSMRKDKADLTLTADNFLQATRNLNTVLETPRFMQESNNYIYLRGVRLAFNYRFGNVSTQPQKRRRGIQNDDAKQGEGGNGQQ